MSTIHICGFYANDWLRVDGMSVTACPEGETAHEAFGRIASNIEHFGGTVEHIRRTWPIGGRRIDACRVEWESPAHGAAARMWHVVTDAPADEWKAKP